MGRIRILKQQAIQEANIRLLNEQSHDYNTIENLTDPGMLLRIIRDNLGLVSDNEAPVEAAFMAMAKNPELYGEVKQMWEDNHYDSRSGIDKLTSALKKQFQDWGMRDDDLATAVAGKIDINKIYHKQSILKSLLKISEWEKAYYKDRGDDGMIEIPELEIMDKEKGQTKDDVSAIDEQTDEMDQQRKQAWELVRQDDFDKDGDVDESDEIQKELHRSITTWLSGRMAQWISDEEYGGVSQDILKDEELIGKKLQQIIGDVFAGTNLLGGARNSPQRGNRY